MDPPNPSVGYPIAAHSITCAAVFVSHEHPDHNWTDAAVGTPTIIQPIQSPAPDQTGSIPSPGDTPPQIDYTRIFAYHDNVQGTKRGPDTITVMDVDGLRIAHMGDIGELQLTPAQIKSMGRVDVLMMPAGGFFTVSPSEAATLVQQIKPKIIIPMHYQTPALSQQLQSLLHPVTEFEAAMKPYAKIETITTRDLTIDPKHLPKGETVYVLKYE
jgi:L-ascorbate metabolism protein UlaG (beta-lactamase superfamily)